MLIRRRGTYVAGLILVLWGTVLFSQPVQGQETKERKQKTTEQSQTVIKAHIIVASNRPAQKKYVFDSDVSSIMQQLKSQFAYKSYQLFEYSIAQDKKAKKQNLSRQKVTTTPTIKIPYGQKGIFYLPQDRFIRIFPCRRDGRLLELEVEVLGISPKGPHKIPQYETVFSTKLWVIDGITFSVGGIPYEEGVLIVALTVNPQPPLKSKKSIVAFDSSALKPITKQ